MPVSVEISVVLPHPEGPMSIVRAWGKISKEMSWRTGEISSPFTNDLFRFWDVIDGIIIFTP
jgi:hypothetical protein